MYTTKTTTERIQIMPMYDPSHPGEIIADTLDYLDLNVYIAAAIIGADPDELHAVVAQKQPITEALAKKLTIIMGGTAAGLVKVQQAWDTAPARTSRPTETMV